ncbi:hypothetical protein MNBD_CHLOROFLEXI01-2792, partial [hydrothermal vent metagenome]
DMIVNGAGGNPLHLAELVKILIQEGVIDTSGSRWYVRMGNLATLPMPLSLIALMGRRLEGMSRTIQAVIQRAAAIGTIFWDMVLLQLSAEDDSPLTLEGLTAVLGELVDQGWIFRRKNSEFSGTQAYEFSNDDLQQIAYNTLTEREQQIAHTRIASWFITHDGQKTTQQASMLAAHLEQAEKFAQGAVWYGRAAEQAREDHAPETAVLHYCQSLNLLPVSPETADQRLSLNEGLGEMLRWLAQFEDATDAYQAMFTAAHLVGDEQAEVRAQLNLFLCHFLQDDLTMALAAAQKGENVAAAADLMDYQLMAQAAIGWVMVLVGDQYTAVQIGKTLYNDIKKSASSLPKAYMQALLGHIARESAHYERAANTTESARQRFREERERIWETLMVAQLGHIAREQHQWEAAVSFYKICLRYARDLGDVYGMVLALRHLGLIAMQQEDYEQSDLYLQQALIQADKSNNDVLRMHVDAHLGQLHLEQALADPNSALDLAYKETHLQQAYSWWEQTLKLARTLQRPLHISTAVAGLAQLFLEDHLLDEALAQATAAVDTALTVRKQQFGRDARLVTAVAWRVLGMVLAKEPSKNQQITVQLRSVSAEDCFSLSHRLLNEIGSAAHFDLLQTLQQWAAFEQLQENQTRATALAQEANQLLQQLNFEHKIKHPLAA